MADDTSTCADESTCISLVDSQNTLNTSGKAIIAENRKLKWNDDLESLKYSVQTTHKVSGKWSSPCRHSKLLNDASGGIRVKCCADSSVQVLCR